MNFFKKSKTTTEIEERLFALEQQLYKEKQENEKLTEELIQLKEEKDQYEEKRNGSEPWVEIIGDSIDPRRGLLIELDWNEAFIIYLEDNGFVAKTDDEIVQKWLASLYADLSNRLQQQVLDDADLIITNEFE